MRVERPDEHVEVTVVVGHLGLGREPGIAVLAGLELTKLRDRWGAAPHVVVVATVDHDRMRRTRGRRRGSGCGGKGATGELLQRGGLDDDGEKNGNRHDGSLVTGRLVRQGLR